MKKKRTYNPHSKKEIINQIPSQVKSDIKSMAHLAFSKLRSHLINSQYDIKLRFEIEKLEESELMRIIDDVSEKLHESDESELQSYIDTLDINYLLIPKSIKQENNLNNIFQDIKSDQVNSVTIEDEIFYIDAPLQIHLLSAMWVLNEENIYAKKYDNNYANILNKNYKENEYPIFNHYVREYNNWRKKSLNVAKNIITNSGTASIIVMDMQRYFYTANIEQMLAISTDNLFAKLSKAMKYISNKYSQKISPLCNELDIKNSDYCLPIGLMSSQILSNAYLESFDRIIIEKKKRSTTNIYYYGRYVDDIILVLDSSRESNVFKSPMEILDFLIREDIPITKDNNDNFHINDYPNLLINKNKVKVISSDYSEGSIISQVNTMVTQQSSEFRYLADLDKINEKIKLSFKELKSGTENGVKDINEFYNTKFQLSSTLGLAIDKIKKNQLNSESIERTIGMIQYYINKPTHLLSSIPIVNKIFKFLVLQNNIKLINEILQKIEKDEITIKITNIKSEKNTTIPKYIKDTFLELISLSLYFTINSSLFNKNNYLTHEQINSKYYQERLSAQTINTKSKATKYKHPELFELKKTYLKTKYLEAQQKINAYINDNSSISDFSILDILDSTYKFNNKATNQYVDKFYIDDISIPIQASNKLKIGVINFDIKEEVTYDPNYLLKDIILNPEYNREKIAIKRSNLKKFFTEYEYPKDPFDMIVLPENSISIDVLAELINFAIDKKVAIIGGLEHFVVHSIDERKDIIGVCYNFQVILLPYVSHEKKNDLFIDVKLKKHYSPHEQILLTGLRLSIPTTQRKHSIYKWRGIWLSTFNCYEFTDIESRSQLKGIVDLICITEQNKDITYFSNLVESTSLDLHCYVVQTNNAKYGDSRICAPCSKDYRDILKIKGGLNTTILIDEINIKGLRDFQLMTPELQSNSKYNPYNFKPTPPNFYDSKSQERIGIKK